MREALVNIEKMAFGGSGFGRVDGKACFVPFTAPDDEVRIRTIRDKHSYMEGEIVEIVTPSPVRVTPPCPVFGRCGGCDWQHLSYERQLAAKHEIFAETLYRIARVGAEQILPIVPSPQQYGYRSRIQLKLRHVSGELHVGFYRSGSHFVVDLPGRCAVAHPGINALLDGVATLIRNFPEPDKVPQVDVSVDEGGKTALVVHYIGGNPEGAAGYLEKAPVPTDGVLLQCGRKENLRHIKGIDSLSYSIGSFDSAGITEISLSYSAGSFSQVNLAQNKALVGTVREWCGLAGVERVLELFCGNGNFTFALAPMAREVVAAEDYAPSIADARRNARQLNVTNVRFEVADSATFVETLAARNERFDLVLLDPPRSGAREVVSFLPQLAPARILYVSCDPPTMARDLTTLTKGGYCVVRSQPFDMFPQTYHIESVTLLERK
ncbi:MAG: class I SAM-dependent RNA methyltransferase [Geobacter sp.]|nr:class I SAM-dependent RNA methyltransferase [Geobacter sp.]